MAEDLITQFIPFLFVLAVVFGALEFSDVFKNSRVKVLISFVIAFFAMTYEPLVAFIFEFLPIATVFFMALFFLGFFTTLFRKEDKKKDWMLIAVVLVLGLILLTRLEELTGASFGPAVEDAALYVGAGIILLMFYAAYRISANQKP